jgi:hypothetical protein
MGGGFGDRPSERGANASSAVARPSALAAALALLLACSGDRIVVAEERGGPGRIDDELDGDDPIGGAGAPGVALVETCPSSPAERRELLGCWPAPHIGTWLGFFIGVPRYERLNGASEEFPTGDVLLRLDLDGTGELRFDDSARAGEPDPCAGVPLSECPGLGRLRAGFGYRLDEIALVDPDPGATSAAPGEAALGRGGRVSFRIRLGEPWEGRCVEPPVAGGSACESGACAKAQGLPPTPEITTDEPACLCGALGCLVRAPSLSISLRMSEDGHALRGAYTPDDGRIPEARLEFLKAPDP